MKILLIGNDKFIAKALADRFLLEEDQVYLLGDFGLDTIDDIPDKVKYFETDIFSDGSRDVFSVQLPDTVVYFEDAQRDCLHDMVLDGVNNHMSKFMNAFALSTWHSVKKFIYISTIELYDHLAVYPGEESEVKAESLWQSAHFLCEQHIQNTRNSSRVSSTILRTSTIYGPGQKSNFSEVAYYLDKNYSKNKKDDDISLPDVEKDYIYIEDFCNAVYRASSSSVTGILNIASGKKAPTSYIKTCVDKIYFNPNISIGFIENKDSVDVTLAATALDFITHVDILRGINGMIIHKQEQEIHKKDVGIKTKIKRLFSKIKKAYMKNKVIFSILAYVENILAFILVAYLILNKDITMLFGYIDIRVLYILIIGAIHGLRQSSISTALCVALFFYQSLALGYDILVLIYDSNIMAAIFVFLLAGMLFGYISDRSRQKINELTKGELKTRKQLMHIKEMYLESLKVKDLLQGQIFNSSNSYGRVFGVVSKLDSLDFNKLKGEIIRVTEEIMENRSISLYMFGRNRGFLRLLAKSQGLVVAKKSITISEKPEIAMLMETGQLYVRKDMNSSSDILMAAPVEYEEEIIAVLVMHKANLDNLTLSYQNLFSITANLVNQAIIRAYKYQQAQEDEWYIEGTGIMKKEYFEERVQQSIEMEDQGVSSYVVLEVTNDVIDGLYERIPKIIREFDYVGLDEKGKLKILLNNTAKSEAGIVLERFSAKGILAKLSEEVV